MRAKLRGKVEEVGAVTVDARLLSELVSTLGSSAVTLSANATAFTVSTKGATSTLKILPAEEFPVIPFPTKIEGVTLPLASLLGALGQVSYAASSDDGRPELTGVLWRWAVKTLTVAATDSYRLAERVLKLPNAAPELSVLVPAKLLGDLSRSLGEGDVEVRVGVNENQVVFATDTVELVSRVIDGHFPEYSGIIPKSHTTTLTASVSELTRSLKAAALFVRPGVNDTTLTITKAGVTVSAANAQVGEGKTEVPATVTGDALTIVFNYRFLLDALATLPGDEVSLEFTTPADPAVLRSPESAGLTALVMPIRA